MSLTDKLKKKRVIPWVGGYLAGGFIALEGVDQLVGYEILPVLAYRIALVIYLYGIAGAAVFAWYHGEVGPQKPTRLEATLQAVFAAVMLALVTTIVLNHRSETRTQTALAEAGLDPKGVAVLYFEDLSADGELAYLADGLTESLIDRLSQVRVLDVVSRGGVEPYRGSEISRDSIARLLDVGTLVVGGVESRGDRIRVQTELIDGFSGTYLEREAFDLPAGDVFAAQDSVADRVSRLLRQQVGEEISIRERRRATDVGEAWVRVQRATRLQSDAEGLYGHDRVDEAMDLLGQADELLVSAREADPNWIEPLTLRAYNTFRLGRFALITAGPEESDSLLGVGLEQIEEALAAAPNDARALEVRGSLNYLRWLLDLNPDAAEADKLLAAAQSDLENAVRIDPTLASAHSSLSHLYYQTGDLVKVVLSARRAYEEDAFLRDADLILLRLFWGHYDLAQLEDAEQWCSEGERRFSDLFDFTECRLWLMLAPNVDPDPDAAWEAAERLESLAPEESRDYWSSVARMIVGGVLGRAGLPDSANTVLVGARASLEVDPEQETMGYEAVARSVMGDQEGAMRLLQQYVAANPRHSFRRAGQIHWWWRNLQSHPEFDAVVGGR